MNSRSLFVRAVRKFSPQKTVGGYPSTVELAAELNFHIKKKMLAGGPLMVSRFGSSELACVVNYLQIGAVSEASAFKQIYLLCKGYADSWDAEIVNNVCFYSGVFPKSEKTLEKFTELFLKAASDTDIFGVWNLPYEGEIISKFAPDSILGELEGLEPYYFQSPWSSVLEGRKVLVVHPFAELIEGQFKKRQALFQNKDVLPSFQLVTLKAVQSLGSEKTPFTNWFEAYEWMCEEILKIDFDVAIIGAGAYGLPLASFVKSLGKQSVHLGGAAQILFGIKGNRWDNHDYISGLYNESWVRPGQKERIQFASNIENGCYW